MLKFTSLINRIVKWCSCWTSVTSRNNLQEVTSFLSALKAGGKTATNTHLDLCEDVIGGLNEAMNLQWQAKTRILYLLCDCPPHGQRFTDDGIKEQIERHLVCWKVSMGHSFFMGPISEN